MVAVVVPHHVTQRGNNRQQVFFSDAQRRFYLTLLAEHAERNRLTVLGYCLMPNHVHAVVVPMAETAMAKAFGRTHNIYARHLNALRRRSGHLWQNRFYSAPLDRSHLLRALRYVDLNPVRARLVERAEDYRWPKGDGAQRRPKIWENGCRLERMPRQGRVVAVDVPHHITHRGNNRQDVFLSDEDRRRYQELLLKSLAPSRVDLLGWCWMSNHVHLVVVPRREDALSRWRCSSGRYRCRLSADTTATS